MNPSWTPTVVVKPRDVMPAGASTLPAPYAFGRMAVAFDGDRQS